MSPGTKEPPGWVPANPAPRLLQPRQCLSHRRPAGLTEEAPGGEAGRPFTWVSSKGPHPRCSHCCAGTSAPDARLHPAPPMSQPESRHLTLKPPGRHLQVQKRPKLVPTPSRGHVPDTDTESSRAAGLGLFPPPPAPQGGSPAPWRGSPSSRASQASAGSLPAPQLPREVLSSLRFTCFHLDTRRPHPAPPSALLCSDWGWGSPL